MKKISRLIQLLPDLRLEDFPTHLKGDWASGLLANWSAAWHPLLISAAGIAPVVRGRDQTSIDEDDDDHLEIFAAEPEDSPIGFDADFWRDSLVFVPEISLESIAHGFAARAVEVNASLVTGMVDRAEIFNRVCQLIELSPKTEESQQFPADRVEDFYALAYAYLQIQLLTRKIRYSSNLDQAAFDLRLVAAANAYANSDDQTCQSEINACYDLLLEEKNNYYPVKPTLIDLVLTTSKTVGKKFETELNSNHVTNFLMTGETLKYIKTDVVEKLKSKLADNQASIVGGNEVELPDTMLSPETTLEQLRLGRESFRTYLNYDVGIFMRRRFGLMSGLPQILDQLNFDGAIHTSLSGGTFPTGSVGTIRWAGSAEGSIMAKADTVLDASDPATFLDLGVTIGNQIDSAHEATCTFAHWPERSHTSLKDLIRVARWSPLLGEFQSLDDHFETLHDPGYNDIFSTEEYASPFLNDAIAASSTAPLSKHVDYWRQYISLHLIECLLLQWCVTLRLKKASDLQETIQPWIGKCDALKQKIELQTATWNHNTELATSINQDLKTFQQELLDQYSQSLSTSNSNPSNDFSIINPLFFTRRAAVSYSTENASAIFHKSKQPFLVQQTDGNKLEAIAETKGSSVTPIRADLPSMPCKKEPPVLDGQKLQNEFFIATIDSKTGALSSILFHGQRGNRASQRLVYEDKKSNVKSTMICDSVESTSTSILSGEIKTAGRILRGDETVANFQQRFRLSRGQQVLELEIDIQPTIELENSTAKYFAHRLAWRDEACKVFGSDQFVRSEIYTPKLQSPNFVDIENLDYTLSLLSGGLPYHQRIKRRQMDTLLIVGKETRRSFKIGIGVDLKYSLKSAIDFNCPTLITNSGVSSGTSVSQQYFQLDSKNILVTHVRPVFGDSDKLSIEMRLHETQRRSGEVTLYTPFEMAEVSRTNFEGDVTEVIHDQDSAPTSQIKLRYAAADYFQIRLTLN